MLGEEQAARAAVWSGADYARIAELFAGIHDDLVSALEPKPGVRWLDVATGTGGVALRAARDGATVTGLDLSQEMLDKAASAAATEGADIRFDLGDAERLPYADASFDVVSSCFGVIFAPDAEAAARELGRVCRPGGRLGMTSWTPNPAIDELHAPYAPAPLPGRERWEDEASVRDLLGHAFDLDVTGGEWIVEGSSGEEVWELWSAAVPPFKALLATLEPDRLQDFRRDFIAFYEDRHEGDVVRERRGFLRILGTRR
jgi:SAM-dependent methyltransferase